MILIFLTIGIAIVAAFTSIYAYNKYTTEFMQRPITKIADITEGYNTIRVTLTQNNTGSYHAEDNTGEIEINAQTATYYLKVGGVYMNTRDEQTFRKNTSIKNVEVSGHYVKNPVGEYEFYANRIDTTGDHKAIHIFNLFMIPVFLWLLVFLVLFA